jgi:ATP-dependent RNA helicase DeaD
MPQLMSNFSALGLSNSILKTLEKIGYETPSPIQEQCITHLLAGKDVIGQAQTGTGKTAAFSLPLLDNVDVKSKNVQVLVLAPTRELAIQVSEAMKTYAAGSKEIGVLSIYGGQSYDIQLKALKRGVQVVVGTPGRVMDHINRKTLKLNNIKALVLDEADEMLRMGFIDDVKWVLERLPEVRQIALFSATMPKEIKTIATKFLKNPEVIKVQGKTETATNITQKYMQVAGKNKLPALKRILEATKTDGIIIFARTKNDTSTISEQLVNFGYKSQALNGDVAQKDRERVIASMKKGNIDIIVATDVAARGIDVPRITHVINYDIPQDVETYVHRIGRTGRAGRSGEAILFARGGDMRMLKQIERHTKQEVEKINLPGVEEINKQRIETFKENITKNLENTPTELTMFKEILSKFAEKNQTDILDIAASLAVVATGGKRFLLSGNDEISREANEISIKADPLKNHPQIPMKRFRIEVGKRDGAAVKNIVGAIANEADIDSEYIGNINILDNFSTIDLPDEMPSDVFEVLKNTFVAGRKLAIAEFKGSSSKKPKQRWDKKKRDGGGNSRNGSRNGGGRDSRSRDNKGRGDKGRNDKRKSDGRNDRSKSNGDRNRKPKK